MDATCPIWLVVGFLGSGKTTLLRRLVHTPAGAGLLYVINEFSAVDVDAEMVEREGGLALAVAGGSIFCRCLVTEFVGVLRRVSEGIQARDGTVVRPAGVVIEASGMADPRSMRRLLAESGLDARFHVAGVTAVVDPASLIKLLQVLPNIRGQIESADLILLNKIDLHAPETVELVREQIVSINPHAVLIRCAHGVVDPSVVLADGASARTAQVDAAFGLCKDPHYERETILFKQPLKLAGVREAFEGAGEGFYRAKGHLQVETGWVYLDWSGGIFSVTPCAPAFVSALVLIWNPANGARVARRLREMSAG